MSNMSPSTALTWDTVFSLIRGDDSDGVREPDGDLDDEWSDEELLRGRFGVDVSTTGGTKHAIKSG